MQKHITVLREEAIDALKLKPDATVIDATLGAGGHATEILKVLDHRGTFLGIDVDQSSLDALGNLGEESSEDERAPKVILACANFKEVARVAENVGIRSADAILADLGWRTEQFLGASSGHSGKGFSFMNDEPLLMTYGDPKDYVFTAYDVVNDWEEEHIADVIYSYGEERNSRRIARAIVEARSHAPIETSFQLAEIVKEASVVRGHRKINPATKTFQAIRIVVNDELGALSEFLSNGFSLLAPYGRLAIISFHSLEDRIVKHTFKEFVRDQKAVLPHKKPIVPTREEIQKNPRARSAKLRVIEKYP